MTLDEYTISERLLAVGDGHELYVLEWGNKDATQTILFLHGGPGSFVKDHHTSNFDPASQRVIFFDQRGCGASTPYGSLENNTTQALVDDITKIADSFDLKKFIITGGSWGSCLALAYALHAPERVTALVLHGIFTGSMAETEWLDKGIFKSHFPEAWDRYLELTPAAERHNPSVFHFKTILSSDMTQARTSAAAYNQLEGSVVRLDDRSNAAVPDDFKLEPTRLEVHYLQNLCFLPDRYILDNAHKLKMPVWLIQGRYDMVCPPITAYELLKKIPNAQLYYTIAGHAPEHKTATVLRAILLQVSQL